MCAHLLTDTNDSSLGNRATVGNPTKCAEEVSSLPGRKLAVTLSIFSASQQNTINRTQSTKLVVVPTPSRGGGICFSVVPRMLTLRSHYSTEITVTDFGSSLRVSLPACAFTETGFGATVLGALKVLMESTLGAVRVSPAADFAAIPATFNAISTGSFGSMFVTSSHSLPALSLAAIASTRGRVMSPCL